MRTMQNLKRQVHSDKHLVIGLRQASKLLSLQINQTCSNILLQAKNIFQLLISSGRRINFDFI